MFLLLLEQDILVALCQMLNETGKRQPLPFAGLELPLLASLKGLNLLIHPIPSGPRG